MINSTEQFSMVAQQVYIRIKCRIKELYRLIMEANDGGENVIHLHEELVMLESIIQDK
jgi:hypothetical protein